MFITALNANGQERDAARAKVSELIRGLSRAKCRKRRATAPRLKLVLRKRQDKAREYFDQLAGKFGRSYVPGRSWQALAHTLISLVAAADALPISARAKERFRNCSPRTRAK